MKGGKEDTDIGLTMRQDKVAKKKGHEAKETRKRKRDELRLLLQYPGELQTDGACHLKVTSAIPSLTPARCFFST